MQNDVMQNGTKKLVFGQKNGFSAPSAKKTSVLNTLIFYTSTFATNFVFNSLAMYCSIREKNNKK